MTLFGRLLANRHAGEQSLVWHDPGLAAPDTIDVTSPAFGDGMPMPKRTAGRPAGANVSPALDWANVPEAARQLVLIVEDKDVPFSRPANHAIARLDAVFQGVGEGELNRGELHGAGRGAFGLVGYHGPLPIKGHGPHSYVFQLFALDRPVPADHTVRPATVVAAMRGHVIARGRLTGTYER